MNPRIITPGTKPAAIELLRKNNLPTEDLTDNTMIFIIEENQKVIGTIGLEAGIKDGLLRSLSVSEEHRGKGYGEQLVGHLEKYARDRGIEDLYLLTTTAEKFFDRRGYVVIRREEVSPFIRSSAEFNSSCPSSAVVMKKTLA
jgi:amino-acid N-acetyltransferase